MRRNFYLVAAIILLFACNKKGINNNNPTQNGDIVYLETNDSSGNAILAYWHENDSSLIPLPGSPFSTGGTGIANPTQALGPDDDDKQVMITRDNRFLLAVNAGSNSIGVFTIGDHGALSAVPGSPFASGGVNPVSVDQSGKYIYVVNKNQVQAADQPDDPNYTVFTIDEKGKLAQVPGSTIETTAGSSPSEGLVSNNGRFLFGADFLGFMLNPAVGTLRSFTIGHGGKITPVAGTPQVIPQMGGALGLWQSPNSNILYVGFPLAGMIGVYSIDENTGTLNFSTSVASGAAVCWLRTNKAGNYLYALNSAENSVSVFNSASAGSPVSIQKIALADPGPNYMAMGMSFPTSEDFSLNFSPSGKTLYVISQYTNPDFSLGNFNLLHVLQVAGDGMLSEKTTPVQLPVLNTARPQGVVSLAL